jgi:hypothetical protein
MGKIIAILKEKFGLRDMLFAIACVGLACLFYIRKSSEPVTLGVVTIMPVVFSFGMAVGVIFTRRPVVTAALFFNTAAVIMAMRIPIACAILALLGTLAAK